MSRFAGTFPQKHFIHTNIIQICLIWVSQKEQSVIYIKNIIHSFFIFDLNFTFLSGIFHEKATFNAFLNHHLSGIKWLQKKTIFKQKNYNWQKQYAFEFKFTHVSKIIATLLEFSKG